MISRGGLGKRKNLRQRKQGFSSWWVQLFRGAGAGRGAARHGGPSSCWSPKDFLEVQEIRCLLSRTPDSYIQNLADFKFFYPKHRLLVTHPSLSVFSLLEVESWLISFQFDFPANFSNSVQKKIIEQLDSHLNTSNLGLLRFPLRSLLFGDQNIFPFYS